MSLVLAVLAAAGAGTFVAMWLLVRHGEPGLDRDALSLLASSDDGLLARLGRSWVTTALEAVLLALTAAGVALLAVRRRWTAVAVIVAGTLCDVAAARAAKPLVGRSRPPHPLVSATGSTFPSTHAAYSIAIVAVAVAVVGVLARRRERIAVIAAAAAFVPLLGAALIAIRVHYATDVLAGWGVGVAAFAGCALAARGIEAAVRRR